MPLRFAILVTLILLTAAVGAGCASTAAPAAPEIPATPDAPPSPMPRPAPVPEPEAPSLPARVLPDAAEAVSLVLPPDPETGKFIRKDSYLSYWMLRSSAVPGDAQSLLSGEFPQESASGIWRAVRLAAPESDAPTLGEQLPAADTVAFLAARLDSSRPLTGLKLHLGGGGLQQLTLNGELLYADTRGARPADAPPEEIPDVTLRKGENHLRIKTVRVAPEWNVRLRLTDAAGAPLRFAPCGERR